MMKFSKRVEYALIAMVELARYREVDHLVTARRLAREYRIPQEILSKVLQKLAKIGLLQSVQGVKGGYTLARKIEQINMLEVVESIDGPFHLVACHTGRPCDCDQFLFCNIQTPMQYVQEEFMQLLRNISLKDLLTRMKGDFSWVYRQQYENAKDHFEQKQLKKDLFVKPNM
ncbi:RrF2 family transcriptional regulator [Calditrichota bacterium LG25]